MGAVHTEKKDPRDRECEQQIGKGEGLLSVTQLSQLLHPPSSGDWCTASSCVILGRSEWVGHLHSRIWNAPSQKLVMSTACHKWKIPHATCDSHSIGTGAGEMAQQSKYLTQEHKNQSSDPQNPLKCQVCVRAYDRPAVVLTSEGRDRLTRTSQAGHSGVCLRDCLSK